MIDKTSKDKDDRVDNFTAISKQDTTAMTQSKMATDKMISPHLLPQQEEGQVQHQSCVLFLPVDLTKE